MKVLCVSKRPMRDRLANADEGHAHLEHLRQSRPSLHARLNTEKDAHEAALHSVRNALAEVDVTERFHGEDLHGRWDLIVSVGGDGTLLWASHAAAANVPLLGINSSPTTSVGYFCAASGDDIAPAVASAISEAQATKTLTRMQMTIDGEVVASRALNDVLFCHESPAATSKYRLELGDTSVRQTSSGVWIGTGAGSTAAIRSAGGKIMPSDSKELQFVVREPYGDYDSHAQRGIVPSLELVSMMQGAKAYVDGTHRIVDIAFGSRVHFGPSNEPLTLIMALDNNR